MYLLVINAGKHKTEQVKNKKSVLLRRLPKSCHKNLRGSVERPLRLVLKFDIVLFAGLARGQALTKLVSRSDLYSAIARILLVPLFGAVKGSLQTHFGRASRFGGSFAPLSPVEIFKFCVGNVRRGISGPKWAAEAAAKKEATADFLWSRVRRLCILRAYCCSRSLVLSCSPVLHVVGRRDIAHL